MTLLDGNDTFISNVGEKLTVIAALLFFLYYFMKELKEVRLQMDNLRKDYEAKHDAMFERVVDCEKKSTEALNKCSDSNDRLAEAVDSLKEKINA